MSIAPLAQLDRATASGAVGQRFESSVARPVEQGVSEIGLERRGSFVAAAQGLLLAPGRGSGRGCLEHGKALATSVLEDRRNVLAKAVLEGGPFAIRRAEELTELVLDGESDPEEQVTNLAMRAATSSRPS